MGLAIICAMVSLFILPEIFASATILIGAQTWKDSPDRTTGRNLVIVGIICMIIGLEISAIRVIDLIFWGY